MVWYHILHFSALGGFSKSTRTRIPVVWLACVFLFITKKRKVITLSILHYLFFQLITSVLVRTRQAQYIQMLLQIMGLDTFTNWASPTQS